ncbi:hypothetical protein SAMN05216559_1066 [Halomicrobium zhouii]|uniref:Uncharacterized protein n=1 Tax=Halomicrobium zhouii TaxID=767519 RepID=A0A1I6KN45_9EURY|nr:hypothetical protein [Halomicrobium zhouii]SFR92408.1 hypothetical protein SAMN05216559_1066 [Halomicrobium zhouii]
MEQLSSCYFCGAALDASLDEYPVVPKDLHPTTDDQKTVVLCQGCRQKLGTVVETIVSVVESPESADPADDRTPDSADSSAGEDPLADEGWVDAGELSSSGSADTGGAAAAADGHATGDASTEEVDDDGSDDVTYTTSTAAGGRRSVSGNAESIRDDSGPSDGNGGGSTDASEGTEASGDTGGNGGEAGDGRPSMTALENTKVMRLLQNREFPVDRAEIKAVAVNAYDMSESQFDTVVDAAVDRGLIGEQNGQIVDGN